MELLPSMMEALATLATPQTLLYLALGVIAGIAIGVVPGVGGTTGMAILLPLAVGIDQTAALAMMIGVLAATSTADTFAAVLFAIPGSSSSQATILDGHPMAKRGEAGRALGAAFSASFIGGLLGVIILTLVIVWSRPVILTFQSPELFMLGLLGMSMVAVLSGRDPIRGLVSASLGLMIGMVGMDGFTGSVRWNFDSLYLFDGISLIVVALGIFALPEIIGLMVRGTSISSERVALGGGLLRGMGDTLRHKFLVLRTAVLGVGVGMLPGLGGSVVDWFAYGHALQTEKGARDSFGKGDIRGVIGVDAATNAKDGGTLVPTLLFGIPGSTPMALLIGLFVMQGLQPGPRMVTEHLDITYSMLWSLGLAQVLVFVLCGALAYQIAKITQVPFHRLAPAILVVIAFAAYQATRSSGDLVLLVVIALLGWFMKLYAWPRPPLVLGMVLSPLLERYLFISDTRYGAAWMGRPIVIIVGVLTIFSLLYGLWGMIRPRRDVAAEVSSQTYRDPEAS